jgi:hypothetical protein
MWRGISLATLSPYSAPIEAQKHSIYPIPNPKGFSPSQRADPLMMFDKIIRQCVVGRNGRAKAGPYSHIRPAEAGAGRPRCPACKEGFSPSQRRDPLQRVRGAGRGLFAKTLRSPSLGQSDDFFSRLGYTSRIVAGVRTC